MQHDETLTAEKLTQMDLRYISSRRAHCHLVFISLIFATVAIRDNIEA